MAILRCPACSAEAAASSRELVCSCGEPFDVEHAFRLVGRETFDARGLHSPAPQDSGVWRFRELVYPRFPSEAVISLREGNTPLYASAALRAFVGLEQVRLKHEGLNPTGSFADRGMTVAVSRAAANGARHLACASTGATAASLAAYSAAAGLACTALVPSEGAQAAKLAQARAFGARTLVVRGDLERVRVLARELARSGALELVDERNPFRIEGQKSIPFELLAQLGWRAPDWIALPAENHGNAIAFAKALREARYLGLIDRLPRLLAAGTECAPASRSRSAERASRALAETHGQAVDISAEQLASAKRAIDHAGLGCDLPSAAGLAGASELVRRGRIGPEESVVVVLDSHLLAHGSDGADSESALEPELDVLRRALET